jgi:hypothetical protein
LHCIFSQTSYKTLEIAVKLRRGLADNRCHVADVKCRIDERSYVFHDGCQNEWRQTRYLTSDHNVSGNGMIESETLDIEATVARKPEN